MAYLATCAARPGGLYAVLLPAFATKACKCEHLILNIRASNVFKETECHYFLVATSGSLEITPEITKDRLVITQLEIAPASILVIRSLLFSIPIGGKFDLVPFGNV